MYAIVETGGKQYRVQKDDVLFVEKIDAEAGETVSLDKVLLTSKDGDVKVGAPYVDGAKVEAEVVEHGKDKKIVVFKFKPKDNFRKKQGHRQPYTKLKITNVLG